MAFARDNNLATKSFDTVVGVIKDNAKSKGMNFEEYLEQY